MKKYKKLIPPAAVLVLLVILLTFGFTSAYLTDMERAYNNITIGKVNIELDEGDFEDDSVVAAGQTLPKAPKVKNTGSVDEYVFLSVAVPKKKVTLLYEDTVTGENAHRKGTKVSGAPSEPEIFRLVADGEHTAQIEGYNDPIVSITYNKGDSENSVEGWESIPSFTAEKEVDGEKYEVYYFGYNKKLAPKTDEWTVTLFDKIQLKSFIDEELVYPVYPDENDERADGSVKVLVKSYGIQANDLGISGLPEGNGLLSKDQIIEIFEIVNRKQGIA